MKKNKILIVAFLILFISVNNLSAAYTTLSNLTIHYIMEANQFYVDSMYLLVEDDYELTTDDSSALFAIADEDPLLGGGAVIDARVVLDYDPEPVGDVNRLAFENNSNRQLKIVPNPNDGNFILDFPFHPEEEGRIQISDLVVKYFAVSLYHHLTEIQIAFLFSKEFTSAGWIWRMATVLISSSSLLNKAGIPLLSFL